MTMTGTKTGMSPSHLPTSRIQSRQKQEVLSEETAGPAALPWSCHLTSRCKSWGNGAPVWEAVMRQRGCFSFQWSQSLGRDLIVSIFFIWLLAWKLFFFLSEIYVPFNNLLNTLFYLYQLMTLFHCWCHRKAKNNNDNFLLNVLPRIDLLPWPGFVQSSLCVFSHGALTPLCGTYDLFYSRRNWSPGRWRKRYGPLWASHWPLACFRIEIRRNMAGFCRNKISFPILGVLLSEHFYPVYLKKKILKLNLVFFRSCALGGYILIPPFLPF